MKRFAVAAIAVTRQLRLNPEESECERRRGWRWGIRLEPAEHASWLRYSTNCSDRNLKSGGNRGAVSRRRQCSSSRCRALLTIYRQTADAMWITMSARGTRFLNYCILCRGGISRGCDKSAPPAMRLWFAPLGSQEALSNPIATAMDREGFQANLKLSRGAPA